MPSRSSPRLSWERRLHRPPAGVVAGVLRAIVKECPQLLTADPTVLRRRADAIAGVLDIRYERAIDMCVAAPALLALTTERFRAGAQAIVDKLHVSPTARSKTVIAAAKLIGRTTASLNLAVAGAQEALEIDFDDAVAILRRRPELLQLKSVTLRHNAEGLADLFKTSVPEAGGIEIYFMRTYKSKVFHVEADRWGGRPETIEAIIESLNGLVTPSDDSSVVVFSPEGPMIASVGDWIVKDSSGAVFPMADEIFSNRYTAAFSSCTFSIRARTYRAARPSHGALRRMTES